MKKFITLLVVATAIIACNNNKTNQSDEEGSDIYTIPSLLADAPGLIDQEIKISGLVEHVCSHAGRRCFIVDSVADESIKIEATGEIESFSKEILGNNILVMGVLREQQLKTTEIDEWEAKLMEEYGDIENGGEQCASEMANINSMREWMKKHQKDYYAIYYIDGLRYEVVE